MNKEFLPKDDSHPLQLTSADIILRQQLENSISSYFFNACDRTIQNLLSSCRWYILSHANALTLVVSNLAPGNMDVKTTTTCKVGKVFNIE